MAIREKKNKDGTTSFYITVYEGYKIDRTGYESQNRKYKRLCKSCGLLHRPHGQSDKKGVGTDLFGTFTGKAVQNGGKSAFGYEPVGQRNNKQGRLRKRKLFQENMPSQTVPSHQRPPLGLPLHEQKAHGR